MPVVWGQGFEHLERTLNTVEALMSRGAMCCEGRWQGVWLA
jgi:hypothetical protein